MRPKLKRRQKAIEPQPLTEKEFHELMARVEAGDEVEVLDIDAETTEEQIISMVQSAPMQKALAGEGVTREYLAQRLREALEANKTQLFFDQRTGKIIYSEDLVYWKVREDARRDAHKLLGHYPPERQEVSGPNGSPINLKTGPAVQNIIQEIEVTILGGEGSGTPMASD